LEKLYPLHPYIISPKQDIQSTKVFLSNRKSQREDSRIPLFEKMKNFYEGQVIGIPVGSSNWEPVVAIKEGKSFGFSWINKLRKRSSNLHKKMHQTCRVERLFRKSFSVDKEERLVKGCKCSLSTTHGPINGTLFISTKKVAFCSDGFIHVPFAEGKIVEVPYKVSIPVKKVKKAIPIENAEQPDEKYLHIITVDNFEFWFMGVHHQKSSNCLENTFSKVQ
jgi:GRAM domain